MGSREGWREEGGGGGGHLEHILAKYNLKYINASNYWYFINSNMH